MIPTGMYRHTHTRRLRERNTKDLPTVSRMKLNPCPKAYSALRDPTPVCLSTLILSTSSLSVPWTHWAPSIPRTCSALSDHRTLHKPLLSDRLPCAFLSVLLHVSHLFGSSFNVTSEIILPRLPDGSKSYLLNICFSLLFISVTACIILSSWFSQVLTIFAFVLWGNNICWMGE